MPKDPSKPVTADAPDGRGVASPEPKPGILYASATDLRGFKMAPGGTALGPGGPDAGRSFEADPSQPPLDKFSRQDLEQVREMVRQLEGASGLPTPADLPRPPGGGSEDDTIRRRPTRGDDWTVPDAPPRLRRTRRTWLPAMAFLAVVGVGSTAVLAVRQAGTDERTGSTASRSGPTLRAIAPRVARLVPPSEAPSSPATATPRPKTSAQTLLDDGAPREQVHAAPPPAALDDGAMKEPVHAAARPAAPIVSSGLTRMARAAALPAAPALLALPGTPTPPASPRPPTSVSRQVRDHGVVAEEP